MTAVDDVRNGPSRTTYQISGVCDGIYAVRADIRIDGTGGGSIGPITDADFDGEALFVDAQSNIRLKNVIITAPIFVRNNSNIRFDGVTLPTPALVDEEYETNVDLRTSYLRINSGSIDDLSLHANRGATAEIKDSVTGIGLKAIADVNSSVVVHNDTVTLGFVEAIGSSFIFANHLRGSEIIAEGGSYIEADELTSTDNIEAWGNSRVAVWGDASVTGLTQVGSGSSLVVDGDFSAGAMLCEFNSSAVFEGDFTTTGGFEWDGTRSVDIHLGCSAQIKGTYSFNGSFSVGNKSTLIDGSWSEISPP